MTPARKKRLGLILLMVAAALAVGVGLALKSLDQNIMFFFTPSEVMSGKAPQQQAVSHGWHGGRRQRRSSR